MRRALVLLALLAACRSPFNGPPAPEWPPIPRQVSTPLGPIPVVIVDSLRDDQGRLLDGGYHTSRRTIYIRRGIESRTRQWQVLRHEECHVALDDSGLANLIPTQTIQALCDAFASARVAEMQESLKPR